MSQKDQSHERKILCSTGGTFPRSEGIVIFTLYDQQFLTIVILACKNFHWCPTIRNKLMQLCKLLEIYKIYLCCPSSGANCVSSESSCRMEIVKEMLIGANQQGFLQKGLSGIHQAPSDVVCSEQLILFRDQSNQSRK